MFVILHALGMLAVDLFKSRSRLEAENLFLRHQLKIALRRAPPRLRLRGSDRALLILITKLWPSLLGVAKVVQPDTILRWHRAGFKVFWRCKSRHRAGRPKIDRGLRDLIQRMSRENPLWGASRIHGELLMLGLEVAQSTVSKYMARPSKPPSQTWRTFLQNHAEAIAAIDMCVVPTLSFDLLFAFLVLGHGRRQLLWFEVTRNPTADWLARQITGHFPGHQRRVIWCATTTVPTARLHVSGGGDGYLRPADLSWITMAKWLRGPSDRHLAARVPGSGGHLRRGAPAAILPPMRRITIKCVRTWHYRKMRLFIEQPNDRAPLSPFRSLPGCITNTFGCEFRKGQVVVWRHYNCAARPRLPRNAGRDRFEPDCVRHHFSSIFLRSHDAHATSILYP